MKCIVSDFDGTLYDNNLEYNISKIKQFVDDGNIFVLATGRTYKSIKNFIKDYNIPYEYLICSDGSCIYDKNDNVIYEKLLDEDLIDKVINICSNYNLEIKYDNNCDIYDYPDKVGRILINADINIKTSLMDKINKLDNAYAYLSTNWLNISNINNDKTVAIKYLDNLNNFDKIYVIGNDINDYAMIKYYNGYLINKNINSFSEFMEKIKS